MAKLITATISLTILAGAGAIHFRTDRALQEPAAQPPAAQPPAAQPPAAQPPAAQPPAAQAPAAQPPAAPLNATEAAIDLNSTVEVDAIIGLANNSASGVVTRAQLMMQTALATIEGLNRSEVSEDIAAFADKLKGLQGKAADTFESTLDKFRSKLDSLVPKFLDAVSEVRNAFGNAQAKLAALRAVKTFLLRYAAGRTYFWPFSSSKPSPEKQAESAVKKANETVLSFNESLDTLNTTVVDGLATVVAAAQEKLAGFQEGCLSAAASESAGPLATSTAPISAACSQAAMVAEALPNMSANATRAVQAQIGLLHVKAQTLLKIVASLSAAVDGLEQKEDSKEEPPAVDESAVGNETAADEGNPTLTVTERENETLEEARRPTFDNQGPGSSSSSSSGAPAQPAVAASEVALPQAPDVEGHVSPQ